MATDQHASPDAPQSESSAEFLARGEAAWQEYLRTGYAVPVDEVFDRIQAAIDARRAVLLQTEQSRPTDCP